MTSMRHDPEEHANTLRLEAFSDGVFAIAITLLVLEIGVPHVGPGESLAGARHLWPSYFGYAVSFLTIGVMWVNHHAHVQRHRPPGPHAAHAELALLMSISFLPFPTAVVAENMRDSHGRLGASSPTAPRSP